MHTDEKPESDPWSVDRWGRLLSGASLLVFSSLALLDPRWFLGDVLVAANLVVTSLVGRCPLHALLIRLGAKEREDLFFPGGNPRCETSARSDRLNAFT